MEYLDIYNDNFELIGSMEKKDVHVKGKWHSVVACLAINIEKNKAYFQRKKWFEDCPMDDENSPLDITVGGHYQKGEKLEDAIREIEEELLEKIEYKDLLYLGVRQCGATVKKDYIANEFHQCFLLPLNKTLKDYNVTGDEVGALVEVDIDEAIELLLNKRDTIKGLQKSENDGIKEINIKASSFMKCWRIKDQFILKLLIASKRYINKENPKLIMW